MRTLTWSIISRSQHFYVYELGVSLENILLNWVWFGAFVTQRVSVRECSLLANILVKVKVHFLDLQARSRSTCLVVLRKDRSL